MVNLSTVFHLHIDGHAEWNIKNLEDILRTFVFDFKGNWDDHLPLMEFAYNNSYYSSIQMDRYEALYGRRCRSPTGWFEVDYEGLIGPYLVHQAMNKVKVILKGLETTHIPTQMWEESHWSLRWMTGYIWNFHPWRVLWCLVKQEYLVPVLLDLIDYQRE